MNRVINTLSQPRVWVAVSVGVAVALLLVLVVRGDGNTEAVFGEPVRARLEVCPDAVQHADAAQRCVDRMTSMCWPEVDVVQVTACEGWTTDAAARLHACETSTPDGRLLCDAATADGEEHPGAEVDGDIYVRGRFELGEHPGEVLCHELLHGVYGLTVHDTHASRVGANPAGSSWVGLDRCGGER